MSCLYANMTTRQLSYSINSRQPRSRWALRHYSRQDLLLNRDASQCYSLKLRDSLPLQILRKWSVASWTLQSQISDNKDWLHIHKPSDINGWPSLGFRMDPDGPRLLFEKLRNQGGPSWTSWLNVKISLTVLSDPILCAVNQVYLAIKSC